MTRGPSPSLVIVFALTLSSFSCRRPAPATELDITDDGTDASAVSRIDRAEDDRVFSRELAQLATDGDFAVRARLALALGRIGDPGAVPTLLKLSSDAEVAVRRQALFALRLLGDKAGREAIETLIAALSRESDEGTFEAALDAIGRAAGNEDLPRIAQLLSDAEAGRRAGAARALGLAGQRGLNFDAGAVEGLARALADPEENVRFMSAFALFRGGYTASPKIASDALRAAAKADPSFEVRALAVRALAKGGALDDAALDGAMRDPDDRVASTAMMAVSTMEEPRRCAAAAKGLEIAAAKAAGDPGCSSGTCIHVVRAALEQSLDCAKAADIARLATRIEESLSRAGADGKTPSGAARARCLCRFLEGRGDLALIACDPDRPYEGKRLLVQRLGARDQKTEADIEALIAFAAEPDLRVVAPALAALAATPADAARSKVLAALSEPRAAVVGAALDAIAESKENFADAGVVPKIAQVVSRFRPSDSGHAPLLSAAAALGALGGSEAASLLATLAADARPEIRNAAREALAQIPGASIPEILPPPSPPRPTSHTPRIAWMGKRLTAIVSTTRGDFTVELRPDLAPATVESFIELARGDFFDGTEIHRVVPNFVVQAGDPTGSGLGDAGYALRCEATSAPYVRGTVGMALSGKDTGGSQFFATLSRQPHLDGNYTAFGEVVEGMEVLDVIEEGDVIVDVAITEDEVVYQGSRSSRSCGEKRATYAMSATMLPR